jgi:hypothetical protein
MKTTQTDNQIELKSSGAGQVFFGVVLVIVGIIMAIFLLGSADDSGKKAPAWTILIGVAMALGGIAAILFAKNRSVTIQKGGNTTVTVKKVLGGGPQAQTIPTANIIAIRLATYIDQTASSNGSGNPNNSRRSTLSLVLNNNDLVEVGSSGKKGGFSLNGINLGSLVSKAPLSKEADQLTAFLGVPLQADDTSSIGGAIKAVQSAFQHEPSQPAPFNPDAQVQPPAAPPTVPTPPVAPPVPPAQPPIPQTPQQVPPTENPGGPPPPYTPQQ